MLLWKCKVIDHNSDNNCGNNINDKLSYTSCSSLLLVPHFDVICDLLLNRLMATWNPFAN